jgi:GT2 family glycosyltransferase
MMPETGSFEHSVESLARRLAELSPAGAERIVAIVVTWNSREHIHRCLDSIGASTVPVITIVIDNDSVDHTSNAVEERGEPRVLVIRTGENLGYAGANNLGLSLAQASGADFAVIINPDATLDTECIERLVGVLRSDERIGMVSPAICYASSDVLWYGGSDINPSNGSAYHLHEGEPRDILPSEPYDTGRASGCVLAVAPERIESVGLLDERYFLYYEEADWSLRIRNYGLRIVVVPHAVAWHDVGHGSGAISTTHHYYMTRNRLLFVAEHGERGVRAALPRSLTDSLISLSVVLRDRPSLFLPCARATLRGYTDYVRGRFGRLGMK